MYPDAPPAHATTLVDLYLTRWQWGVEVEHWRYNSYSDTRCTGQDGEVDCSGGCVACANYALAIKGMRQIACTNSADMARACHAAPRPQWMQDHFGADPWNQSMHVGTGISQAQANATPGACKFHGPREGEDGYGDAGHIATKWYLNDGRHPANYSIEAMGRYAGVDYSVFLDGRDTYYAILPQLAAESFFITQTQPSEGDMPLIFICPNKPVDANGNQPHAEFFGAGTNPFLPDGGCILHWGASIAGDLGHKSANDPRQRIITPLAGGNKWIGMSERVRDGKKLGVMAVNQNGETSPADALHWS